MAVVFTFVFVLYVIPRFTGTEEVKENVEILTELEKLPGFRNFVVANKGCYNSLQNEEINTYVEEYLPAEYDYEICIDDISTDLPDKNIFIDSVIIAGNISEYNPKTVRLFHWIKG